MFVINHKVLPKTLTVPIAASAVGFNSVTFLDDFNTFSLSNWCTTNSSYATAFFANQGAGTPGNPDPLWFTCANSVLTVSQNSNNSRGTEVCSFKYNPTSSSQALVPLIDGSRGGYLEVRAAVTLPSDNSFAPDFWMQDFTGIVDQVNGAGTLRFAEIDLAEWQTTGFYQSYNEWTAWNNRSFNVHSTGSPISIDANYHLYGARWRTMAQNSGTGILEWFLDGVSQGTPLTWTHTSDSGGAIESAMFEINFSAGTTTPISVDYIGVWQ